VAELALRYASARSDRLLQDADGERARQDLIGRLAEGRVEVSAAIDEAATDPATLERFLLAVLASGDLGAEKRHAIVLDLCERECLGAFRCAAGMHLAFSVAEQLVVKEEDGEALSLVTRVPPPSPDQSGKVSSWPQTHHLHALVELRRGNPEGALDCAEKAIDVFRTTYAAPDPQYFESLLSLRDHAREGIGASRTETGRGVNAAELRLVVRVTGHGPESRWALGRSSAPEWLNDFQTAVAKVTARYLSEALSKDAAIRVTTKEFAERLRREENVAREESTFNKARAAVGRSLRGLVGTELIEARPGRDGGIVFHPAKLHTVGIRHVRIIGTD
jgi:hypothetical protein